MDVYELIQNFSRMLRNIEGWTAKAEAHATAQKLEPGALLEARLAPDQWHFIRQVQGVCDTAKYAAAKLAGREPPVHPDTERTFEDLRARLAVVRAYLETFTAADFAGSDQRPCSHGWMMGKSIRGTDYMSHYSIPNFYFHAATAYAILRHKGVPMGKGDYLGPLPFQP